MHIQSCTKCATMMFQCTLLLNDKGCIIYMYLGVKCDEQFVSKDQPLSKIKWVGIFYKVFIYDEI